MIKNTGKNRRFAADFFDVFLGVKGHLYYKINQSYFGKSKTVSVSAAYLVCSLALEFWIYLINLCKRKKQPVQTSNFFLQIYSRQT